MISDKVTAMANEMLSIKIMNELIEHKQTVNFLGMYIDEKLDWYEHINYIKSKYVNCVVEYMQ